MAVNDTIPNRPKKPDMITVKTLMGMCKPNELPNTLKKNKSSTPIPIFTIPCPRKRVGRTGAPTMSNKIIHATIATITKIEFNVFNPFFFPYHSMSKHWKKERF